MPKTPAKQNPRADRRSSRTKKAIAEGMLQLLRSKHFMGITVNDICLEAQVSRATFYLYFEDKYHLVHFILDRFRQDILAEVEGGDLRSVLEGTVDYLGRHKKLLRNLVLGDDNDALQNMLQQKFVDEMDAELVRQQKQGRVFQVPTQLLAVFYASGTANILIWWIMGKLPYTSSEMAEYLMRMATDDVSLPQDGSEASAPSSS